jgi:hypothetical protein
MQGVISCINNIIGGFKMNPEMEFTVALIIFAPVLVAVAIFTALITANLEYKVKSEYMDNLLDRCVKAKGFEFVKDILEVSKNTLMSRTETIKLLETSCNIEHEKTLKEKFQDKCLSVFH